jgi:hypothetical protein
MGIEPTSEAWEATVASSRKAGSKMVRKRPRPSDLGFFLIASKSLNVGANPPAIWFGISDAQIREQRGNIKRSLPFPAVILCSFGYPEVLEIPDQGALSRQRSRVRVSSSPPFPFIELPDVTPETPTHSPTDHPSLLYKAHDGRLGFSRIPTPGPI